MVMREKWQNIETYMEMSSFFYIKKGSEMLTKFPLKIAHGGDGKKAIEVAKSAAKNLRPILIKWIEAIETNTETRRRLSHKGLSSNPSDVSTQWSRLGLNRDYLPLKIENGDWISHKLLRTEFRIIAGPTTWLSCHNSIHAKWYCGLRSCPGLSGVSDGRCGGESFEI